MNRTMGLCETLLRAVEILPIQKSIYDVNCRKLKGIIIAVKDKTRKKRG